MPGQTAFHRYSNFELAFQRVIRSSKRDYKYFQRHLFAAYGLCLKENLQDLIKDIKTGAYEASPATMIYQPKASGVLRPLALLTLNDQIVYQAAVNIIADKFEPIQQKYALSRSFGAVYAGSSSPFFYRSWKQGYGAYNQAIARAFKTGNRFVADFDLVSFYELIDHHLLRDLLETYVHDGEMLDLLFTCLRRWTANVAGSLAHGVPQGPEASAFLAECLLFQFDRLMFRNVVYLRYVDDIKLMAAAEAPLRRALMKLDLASKELGLVPQAQKIGPPRKVSSVAEITKTIPSGLVGSSWNPTVLRQSDLLKNFRTSMSRSGRNPIVKDVTRFKYCLPRLNPRRDVLKRIIPLLQSRPDLAGVLAAYLSKFPNDREAADALLSALKLDPTYDFTAAAYIAALDVCEPKRMFKPYRSSVRTARNRSGEGSILLPIAAGTYFGRRASAGNACRIVEREHNPLVRSLLIHNLFGDSPRATFQTHLAVNLLAKYLEEDDADLARYSAALHLSNVASPWLPSRRANFAAQLLAFGVGLRVRAPRKSGILDSFFKVKMKIAVPVPWKRALGRDLPDVERRCIRLQKLSVGDPSATILILDTFNESLIQAFSFRHPRLRTAYKKASGAKPHPDYGAWLLQPDLAGVLQRRIGWFREVHDTRTQADLAHAKVKGGRRKGKPTRAVRFNTRDRLMNQAKFAWAELINSWVAVLRPPIKVRVTTLAVPVAASSTA